MSHPSSSCESYVSDAGRSVESAVKSVPDHGESQRLQRCINDLVCILALPAMWSGHESSRVATTLLGALVRMLRLDFAYVRVSDGADGSPAEWVRCADGTPEHIHVQAIGRVLEPHLSRDGRATTLRVANPVGGGTASVAVFHLGLEDAIGVFVAGSRRPDFPTEIERLLLRVATNQATIALQEARRVRQRRRATEELERKVVERTAELKLLVDFVPQFIGVLEVDGTVRYVNRTGLDHLGRTLEEIVHADSVDATGYHREDLELARAAVARALSQGVSAELEARLRRHDGAYPWFMIRYEPLRNEQGRILGWYWTGIDIDERRRAEERVREENLALREEVDKTSMFEEIVGVSPPLRTVLSHVARVGPMDSTVLITGETGTGKELIARAIHKRSPRSAGAFVSVNCAAIPASLIASELFGHEKGAFTGAVQRRQGRFELADGGTIFLDEVGELPGETQMTLLRVLQEREFERVGGSASIRVNVRVIAATNRDLGAAIADGTFRADLFYRLNVFPLELPALRERRADIPLLVEYFTHRYAKRTGKSIHGISKDTLSLLQSYEWPGNIRELQNVIERAVIVSDAQTLSIDERWLARRPLRLPAVPSPCPNTLATQEKDVIEAAHRASKGRVAGPFGAAARRGVPSSTLESKVKALKIDKRRFKSA
jgi:PAS domain S-box-containing protein